MKIHTTVNEIRAAMLFASKDKSRLVLNGVHFQTTPNKQPILVATDGRRLAVIRTEAVQEGITEAQSFTISSVFLSKVCAFVGRGDIAIEYTAPSRLSISFDATHCTIDSDKGDVIEMNFPAWKNTIPKCKKEPVSDIGMNAKLVSVFAEASRLLNNKSEPFIRVNLFGDKCVLEIKLTGVPAFYGILMPAHNPVESSQWQPDFLQSE